MRIHVACAATLLSVAAACSDVPTTPVSGSEIAPASLSATIVGTIVTPQVDSNSAILFLTTAGDSVVLLGPVALEAAQTPAGAQLWVTGVFNSPNEMYVSTYETRSDSPYLCSPMIVSPDMRAARVASNAARIELPCQDDAATRRRR